MKNEPGLKGTGWTRGCPEVFQLSTGAAASTIRLCTFIGDIITITCVGKDDSGL